MNKSTSNAKYGIEDSEIERLKKLLSSIDDSNLDIAKCLFEAYENTKNGWKHENGTIKCFKDFCNELGFNEKIAMKILKNYNSTSNTFHDIDKARNLFLDLASL